MTSKLIDMVLLLVTIKSVRSWPNGAPYKTCVNGFPKHSGSDQQLTPPPFEIVVNESTYRPLQVLQVTLRSKDQTKFLGFQIGARLASSSISSSSSSSSSSFGEDTDVILGEWIAHDDQTTRLQYWYPEKHGTHNCATHRNKTAKEQIVLLWRAPSQNVGDIVFRSGFVKNYDTFWSGVESPIIRSQSSLTVTTKPTSDPGDVAEFSTANCHRSKGCFLYPKDCSDGDCSFGVTYQYLGDEKAAIRFEMIGRSDEYVSLALSTDQYMGEDETVTCISTTDNRNAIQHGYNPSQHNDHHRSFDLYEKQVVRMDGRIFCSFVRPLNTSITYIIDNQKEGYRNVKNLVKTFDLSEQLFIQIAWGTVYKGAMVIRKHIESPLVTPSAVGLFQKEVVYGVGIPAFIKAHAFLGFFAWVFLTGCAMIVARHCRQILNSKVAGTALWFQLHRGFMFTAAVATSVLIIVIFASVGKWSQRATIHAILGLTTAGLTVVQIIFGMLRPGLDSSRRPMFNYFHRTIAIGAQSLAVATLILGARIDLLPSDLSYNLTVIIVVSVAVLLFFELALECIGLFTCIQVAEAPVANDGQLQMESDKSHVSSKVAAMNSAKRFILFLFALSAMAALIVFIIYISIV